MRAVGLRVLVCAALIASPEVARPITADAHDSLAPPGAEHDWLPREEWVFRHWIPFDVKQLQRALGLSRAGFEAYLFNDHRLLADLARSRGIDVDRLAGSLVAPWSSSLGEPRVSELRDRTMRLLTQGHLAQHVFLHAFHTMGAETTAARLTRISRTGFRRRRMSGLSPVEIARQRGVAPVRVRRGMLDLLRTHQADGVRLRQAWPAQSRRVLAEQVAALPCWMVRPLPTLDPGNPFGKARFLHGAHPAGSPVTGRQQRENERRVERFRQGLEPSCWRRPRAWSGHGPALRCRLT